MRSGACSAGGSKPARCRSDRRRGGCAVKEPRLVYRGGNWNNGGNAGVFYANGNNPRSNYNTNIGFRPALASTVRAHSLRVRATQRSKGCISRCIAPKIEAAGNGVKSAEALPPNRAGYTRPQGQKPGGASDWRTVEEPGGRTVTRGATISKEREGKAWTKRFFRGSTRGRTF